MGTQEQGGVERLSGPGTHTRYAGMIPNVYKHIHKLLRRKCIKSHMNPEQGASHSARGRCQHREMGKFN